MTLSVPLIDAAALRERLASAEPPVLLDTSFDLADPSAGERSYAEGHLPGAHYLHLDRDLADHARAPGAPFRGRHPLPSREAFLPLLAGRPAGEVVHQCGSGVTACHNLLAMEAAGLSGAALYPGSWSEWCADPARPVARG